uniref:Uncharacterized protein n=1 Tax=Sphaerodactylus townsendi TaxID=933632 RepID=A0ACB8EXA9_9SAUR
MWPGETGKKQVKGSYACTCPDSRTPGSYLIWFLLEKFRNAECIKQLPYFTRKSLHFNVSICTNDSGDNACAL